MATYVNNLRLKEIVTGAESGTWGTSTNTNLELIADALGSGTEAITTNADAHTTTIADGAADEGRALFLKYTGTLDSACTITLAPNTVNKVWFIENATSGSQNIIISQGSGANITIANGKIAVILTDGAGSGAAVLDALADLELSSTLSVAGASTLTGVTTHGGNVVSDADSTDDLGTTGVRWANLWVDAITMGGTLGGAVGTFSSTLAVTGTSTLTGNVGMGTGAGVGHALEVVEDAADTNLGRFKYTATAAPSASKGLNLWNTATGSTTDGGLVFSMSDNGGVERYAGSITVDKVGTWTSDGATQDTIMRFNTAINGTVAERMRINQAGVFSITSAVEMASTLAVTGHVGIGQATEGTVSLASRCDDDTTSLGLLVRNASGTSVLNTTGAGLTTATTLAVTGVSTFSDDVKVAATKKLYLDGGSNTYIVEESADDLHFVTNGTARFTIGAAGRAVHNYGIAPMYPAAGLGSYWATADEYALAIWHNGNATSAVGMAILCGTDDNSGTNTAIRFMNGVGTTQGSITQTSGTVSYNAFTAGHDASLPVGETAYAYGTLVEIVEVYYKQEEGQDMERGILYKVQKSQSAYAKNVLGAYSGQYTESVVDDDNLHQIYCLGDGHILCNGENGDIEVGDGICTSSTEGEGMKADQLSMIIGIAQEDTSFSSASETKLVPVQYGLRQFQPWD